MFQSGTHCLKLLLCILKLQNDKKKKSKNLTFLGKFLSVCVQLKSHLPCHAFVKKKEKKKEIQCQSALTFYLDKCTSAVFLTSRPHSYFYCSCVDSFSHRNKL